MLPRRDELKSVVTKVWPLVVCVVILTVSIFLHPEPPRWLVFIVGITVGGSIWQIFVGSQHAIILGRAQAMLDAMTQATDEMTESAEFVKEGGELVLRLKDPNRPPVLEKRERNLH